MEDQINTWIFVFGDDQEGHASICTCCTGFILDLFLITLGRESSMKMIMKGNGKQGTFFWFCLGSSKILSALVESDHRVGAAGEASPVPCAALEWMRSSSIPRSNRKAVMYT
ncbi:hypothetical protein AKJ16_DCAP13826 [Drosera capensis]